MKTQLLKIFRTEAMAGDSVARIYTIVAASNSDGATIPEINITDQAVLVETIEIFAVDGFAPRVTCMREVISSSDQAPFTAEEIMTITEVELSATIRILYNVKIIAPPGEIDMRHLQWTLVALKVASQDIERLKRSYFDDVKAVCYLFEKNRLMGMKRLLEAFG